MVRFGWLVGWVGGFMMNSRVIVGMYVCMYMIDFQLKVYIYM